VVKVHAIDRALCPTFFTTGGEIAYRWSETGDEVFFDYNQRGHQIYRILTINAATAAVRTVVEETSATFIDYTNKTWREWLPGGHRLLWLSERDGFAHLWLFDVAGRQAPLQLTRGDWVVRKVDHVDAERGQVWFYAGGVRPGEDPYHLHLCRVNLDGSGFARLTEGDGSHRVSWSPDRRWFVDTWSRIDQPPVTELRLAANGALIATLETADASALLATGWTAPERFSAPGRDGHTPIYGVIIRPPDFDPARHYPVLEEVYAGPQDAFSPKTFSFLPRQQALARLGYVVVQADGMGTNHRGRAFHSVAWKNLKDAGFLDRIAWMRAAAATRPWMDLAHVGIYGGSAGGQSAMRALLDHSDFYSAAFADCGCHDNRMDKIWWNEQWLGWPIDASYAASSNMEDAERLKGRLFLMVGEQDTNVDPASTFAVVDHLTRAGKDFEFLPLPGVGHGAAETAVGKRRRMDFFLRNLPPAPPR
jgi:dipeptidyl-peptidase 4